MTNLTLFCSMRFLRLFSFFALFSFVTAPLYTQNVASQKSYEAQVSDELFATLTNQGLSPIIQPLENALSTDFPYNIIVEYNKNVESNRKLVLVFPQSNDLYIDNIVALTSYIQESNIDYAIDILFSANEISVFNQYAIDSSQSYHAPAGSSTYINNNLLDKNIATVIISHDETKKDSSSFVNFPLFSSPVEITPGGVNSIGESTVIPLSFFSTVIDSFVKANVSYTIKGYFLSLYQLNLISDDYIIGNWLENSIPTVHLHISDSNNDSVFKMLNTLLSEFPKTNFENQDTNYSFVQFFSRTFFVSERLLLLFILLVTTTVLFGFINFSFIKGAHKHIHKNELKKTWYLIPIIVIATGCSLFVSQIIVQALIPNDPTLALFSFAVKILFSILFMLLFSHLQYAAKLPLTGFIYAYTLSISAIVNIIIFSILEITLAPLFVGQYIIVQISQRMRKVVPIILSFLLMIVPYFPLVFNIVSANDILNVESIMNAHFGMNILLACFMLPWQIMVIRILTRLKVWGMRHKISKEKILKQSIVIICIIAFLTLVTVIITKIVTDDNNAQAISNTGNITLTSESTEQFGNILHNLEISSQSTLLKCIVEVESENTIAIYDANYPYDILSKPFTAIFTLEDHPPNPLVLSFITEPKTNSICRITAWVLSENIVQKVDTEYVLQESP